MDKARAKQLAEFFRTLADTSAAPWNASANFTPREPDLHASLAELYDDRLRPLKPGPSYKVELERRIRSPLVTTYLETGVNTGESLRLCSDLELAIGVDPAPKLPPEGFDRPPFRVERKPSDAFFQELFGEGPSDFALDLAFIDGLHVFEFALRDFIGVEALAAHGCTVLVHDVLPRRAAEAARHRFTRSWTGDVWRLPMVLRQFRPDLRVELVAAAPTGLAVITGLDAANTLLIERYDEVVAYGLRLSVMAFLAERDAHVSLV
ncbi:MAG: class I SAM-dependent methyltransferase [Rhodobacteraceae bacterium]|nr:MAG: class I SAM-dependent methyltransferase [Paracoccaceae bacterium]